MKYFYLLALIFVFAHSSNSIKLSEVIVETGNSRIIEKIALSNKSKYLISIDKKTMVIYDIKTHKMLKKVIFAENLRDFTIIENRFFLIGDRKIIIYNILLDSKKIIDLTFEANKIYKSSDNTIILYDYNNIYLLDSKGNIIKKIKLDYHLSKKILTKKDDLLYIMSTAGALFSVNIKNDKVKTIIKSVDEYNHIDKVDDYNEKIYTDNCPDGILDFKNNTFVVAFNYENYHKSGLVKYDLLGNVIYKKFYNDEIISMQLYENKIYFSTYFGDIKVVEYKNGNSLMPYIVNDQKNKSEYVGMSISNLIISKNLNSIFVSSGKFIHQFSTLNNEHCIYGSGAPSVESLSYDKKHNMLYTAKHDIYGSHSLISQWDLKSGIKVKAFAKQSSIASDIIVYNDEKLIVLSYEELFFFNINNHNKTAFKNAKVNYLSNIKLSSDNKYIYLSGPKLQKINIDTTKSVDVVKAKGIIDFALSNNKKEIIYAENEHGYFKTLEDNSSLKVKIPINEAIVDDADLVLSKNNKYLITSTGFCNISVYDLMNNKSHSKHQSVCSSLASTTGLILASNKHDNQIILSTYGEGVFVYDFIEGKTIKKINTISNFSTHVKRLNRKYIGITFSGGITEIINNEYNVVVRLFEFSDNDWLTITPEGYFTGSRGAVKHLNITKYTKHGMEPFDFSQL